MIIAITCLVAIAVIAFILTVRPKDIPEPEPVSPFAHLDDRKAAIYENLRDLQFEYRVGKLSDTDYQAVKQDLQKELAAVMAEIDKLRNGLPVASVPQKPKMAAAKPHAAPTFTCPTCNATFDKDLKFCGECGKPMKVAQ
jgi:rRNA maturation endonuclease Nob1